MSTDKTTSGSESPENPTDDRDGQTADEYSQAEDTPEIDYKFEYEKAQRELKRQTAIAKRQGSKIGKIEDQLNELLGHAEKGEQIDDEELDKAPKALRELLKRKEAELAKLQDDLGNERKARQYDTVKSSVGRIASSLLNPDLLDDDVVALHSSKFTLEDGEILTSDGLTPEEYFEAYLANRPQWAKPAPRFEAGIKGRNTKAGKKEAVTPQMLRVARGAEKARLLNALDNGEAVMTD